MDLIAFKAIPFIVALSHLVLLVIALSFVFKHSWGKEIVLWLGKHSLSLGAIISTLVILGSVFYSNVMGFEPCVLCWWQRVGLFPLLAIFLLALKGADRNAFRYVWPLSLFALIVSLYQVYIQSGGDPLVPCDAANSCLKLYVSSFGYITLPVMAATAAIYMLVLWRADRSYQSR